MIITFRQLSRIGGVGKAGSNFISWVTLLEAEEASGRSFGNWRGTQLPWRAESKSPNFVRKEKHSCREIQRKNLNIFGEGGKQRLPPDMSG